jgi:hypothetical protein
MLLDEQREERGMDGVPFVEVVNCHDCATQYRESLLQCE